MPHLKHLASALALAAACSAAAAAAQTSTPAPQPMTDSKTYTNPVWDRDFPDPHIIRHQGKFYAYGTGFQVMESDDLVHWTHRGSPFRVPWAKEHPWAPEVTVYRGRFYMTYSALNPETRKHDIGMAVADSPLGPFTHQSILVRGDNNRVGVIDATVFRDADGTPYLVYSEEEPRRIVLKRLTGDLLKTIGEPVELVRPDRDWERNVTEAPTMLLRNGRYYLFYSVGWYQSTKQDASYAVCYAVAPSVRGPYVKAEKPLLATVPDKVYGPGHQCLVELPSGEMWMAYHGWDARGEPLYGRNPAGRTMRIDRLRWEGDTPVMDGPTTTPQPAPRVEASGRR